MYRTYTLLYLVFSYYCVCTSVISEFWTNKMSIVHFSLEIALAYVLKLWPSNFNSFIVLLYLRFCSILVGSLNFILVLTDFFIIFISTIFSKISYVPVSLKFFFCEPNVWSVLQSVLNILQIHFKNLPLWTLMCLLLIFLW